MTADDQLESAIDELYGLRPEEFTGARDELAKRLAGEGDRKAAAVVKKLRRPTVAAWAVNRLVRDASDEVERLLEAGERVRRAQDELLSGKEAARKELREATLARRDVVSRLGERATAVLEEAGRDGAAHLEAIVGTLDAASLDESAADALRQGRLTKEIEAASGFGELAASVADRAAGTKAPKGGTRTRAESRRAAREELARARAAADDARTDADRARREADEAAREVDALERRMRSARRAAERAGERAEERRRRAEDAERAVREARDRLEGIGSD